MSTATIRCIFRTVELDSLIAVPWHALSFVSFDCLQRANYLNRSRLNYQATQKLIGEACKVPENCHLGIGLNGSIIKRIVAAFITYRRVPLVISDDYEYEQEAGNDDYTAEVLV